MASEAVDQGGHGVRAKVVNAVVRGVVGSVENVTRGLLAVTYSGKKRNLPNINNPILLESACTLAEKIRKGKLKSVDVVHAYIRRIQDVNPVINAVIDNRFKEALEEAAKVDLLVQSGLKTPEELTTETPFLGVPFSSKEAVLVQGLSATGGLMCRKGMTSGTDSDAVNRLRKAGGIPLVVTNTSEVCMWWESYNNLYGKTNNPYDTTRTVGGSSGGEAALLGAAGSVIGLGTDLGGSIRLPSYFCGVFGHKPSNGIIPVNGVFPPIKEQISPYAVTGPMARYARDLRQLLKVLVGDDIAKRIKLDEQVNFKSIKVYYMLNDGGNPFVTPVSSEVRDCFKNVIFWLKNLGIRTESVRLGGLKHGFLIWGRHLAEVKDQTIADLMSGEVKSAEEMTPPHQEMLKWMYRRSDYTFPLILNACIHSHVAPRIIGPLGVLLKKAEKLRGQLQELLGTDGVFLYPSYPTTAPYHGEILANPLNLTYNVIFNALGFPVTQCALGIGSSGMPVGLQVVAAPMNDRLSLTFAEEIEKQFGGWMDPSEL